MVFVHLLTCLSAANKEYYHQWSVEECHGCSLDLSAFTVEELDNITSEYTLKNTVSVQATPLNAALCPALTSPASPVAGHLHHGRVLPVGESRVRVAAGLVPAALQARVSPGDYFFRAPGSPRRQHLLQQHGALPPAPLGFLHRLG